MTLAEIVIPSFGISELSNSASHGGSERNEDESDTREVIGEGVEEENVDNVQEEIVCVLPPEEGANLTSYNTTRLESSY